MLSQHHLAMINQRLKQSTGIHSKPFGGLSVILIGDPAQLLPVGGAPLYAKPTKLLQTAGFEVYQHFKVANSRVVPGEFELNLMQVQYVVDLTNRHQKKKRKNHHHRNEPLLNFEQLTEHLIEDVLLKFICNIHKYPKNL